MDYGDMKFTTRNDSSIIDLTCICTATPIAYIQTGTGADIILGHMTRHGAVHSDHWAYVRRELLQDNGIQTRSTEKDERR